MKVNLSEDTWEALVLLARKESVYLEGSVLNFIEVGDDLTHEYLKQAVASDRSKREKRLKVTYQVQEQNKELLAAKELIERSEEELKAALEQAEQAKEQAEQAKEQAEQARERAEHDLDYLQKRTQFELMGRIVKVALWVIMGVGITTTTLYAMVLFGASAKEADATLLANTWSNMFGILLTNSFSIIGTIMGVKYATERES